MSDLTDDYKAMTQTRKEQHEKWYLKNMAVLNKSGKEFEEKDTACLFREDGKPAIDFYPHTGRWKKVSGSGKKRVYRGGAVSFLNWYTRQGN